MRLPLPIILSTTVLLLFANCATNGGQAEVPAHEAKPLDGKTFVISVGEKGKPLDTPHTLAFQNGTLESPECMGYGFPGNAYETDGSQFTTTFVSRSEGTLTWTGTIVGDRISGKSRWSKDGQKDIDYWFEGNQR